MTRKTLGYIELIWTCDSCGTKNPGAIKSCTNCGAPQPLNVKFEKVDAESFNYIKDEALVRMAKSGPDKHCPYCGTRNLADAEVCVECGGDLRVGATSRPVGEVLEGEVQPLPSAAQRPVEAQTRQPMPRGLLIGIILVALAACVFLGLYFARMSRTSETLATVAATSWERTVVVEAHQLVSARNWQDNIPAVANILDCELRYRYDSQTYQPNSEEVCGTPYTVDTGTGFGEVVQDCYYRVSENYCDYEYMDWTVIDTLSLTGSDLNAEWPSATLGTSQRFGSRSEQYTIWFDADGDEYALSTSDYALYQLAWPGSDWVLEINGFGRVTSAQPSD